ncbi:MAG TPA: high-affinity iron transporter [Flavobacteriales bacterium]|nr:high-affinity iron transporter [Flavobacteriales bacterium]HIO67507.1 high-affinity iron transporter [Flavobacteriales bacterium]
MQEFIITFRETFEVALIAGIVLSFLKRTKQSRHNIIVYSGIGLAVAVSIVLALIINQVAGGFSGETEEIFEGIMMYLSVIFLSFMILWTIKHKHHVKEIEEHVATDLNANYKTGLFLLIFVAVLREGIETVLFLRGIIVAYEKSILAFSLLGIVAAVAIAWALFKGMVRFNMKKFFNISSTLLILFAAGLLAHGTHELQEAGILPVVVEHLWDINPESITHPLHEKGVVGSVFKSLFGYNGNPSLIEVLSYLAFLLITLGWWRNYEKQQELKAISV